MTSSLAQPAINEGEPPALDADDVARRYRRTVLEQIELRIPPVRREPMRKELKSEIKRAMKKIEG